MEPDVDAGGSGVVAQLAILYRTKPNGVCAITTPAIMRRDLVMFSSPRWVYQARRTKDPGLEENR